MDFQITVDAFKKFITRCQLGGAVKDLLLQATNEYLFAKFSNQNHNFYCEVYEKNLTIKKAGMIRIAKLSDITAILSRTDSEILRIVATDNLYVITDGSQVGKMRVDLTPAGGADLLESWESVRPMLEDTTSKFFDKEKLEYNNGSIKYNCGMKLPVSILETLLKDAKAFKIESYKLFIGKDGILTCTIKDNTTGQSFTRKLQTISKIGEGEINPVLLGSGFREMITSLMKDSENLNVNLMFSPESILFTDGASFYYNLHTVIEN